MVLVRVMLPVLERVLGLLKATAEQLRLQLVIGFWFRFRVQP
jgi:hypothetical protein